MTTHQYKVVRIHPMPLHESLTVCTTPEACAAYWHSAIAVQDSFDSEVECLAVILLNGRHRILGHHIVSCGGKSECQFHPREAMRSAVIAGASAIVMMHNHPSGDPQPSAGDLKATKVMASACELMRIPLLDHVIIGDTHCSLKEVGLF